MPASSSGALADLDGRTFDVVVAGYGCAGASAAVGAADAGGSVLLLEKAPHLGGLSLRSSGFMRVANDAEKAAAYLDATNAGRVPYPVVQGLAHGMVELPDQLRKLAAEAGAEIGVQFGSEQAPHQTEDLYDWPGREALGWAGVTSVEGFEAYEWATFSRGHLLMAMLERNVARREIEVSFSSALDDLVVDDGTVTGVRITTPNGTHVVSARGGVVLATGGFEFEPTMLADFHPLPTLFPVAHAYNTGDGLKAAQRAGAQLWHMWHIHGSYGFKVPDYPVAFRNHMGGARRNERSVAWIIVDQHGTRYMNEAPPAPQDTPWRDMMALDSETGTFPRVPSWLIFDEPARKLGPIAKTRAVQGEPHHEWSQDNLVEVELGWIRRASSVAELAEETGLPASALASTLEEWNRAVAEGHDPLGRPQGTMTPVATPPFYAIETWPTVTNTQGGPRHDEHQRVLTPDGRAIPGLYTAGELGSVFGHVYLLGGNLSEGIIGGDQAGRMAVGAPRRDGKGPERA